MRLIRVAMAIVFLLIGVTIAALNPDPVHFDLLLTEFDLPLGLLVLAVLVGGVLMGGAVLAVSSLTLPRSNKTSTGNSANTK